MWNKLGKLWLWAALAIIISACLFPIFWMVVSSFKRQAQNIAYPPVFIFKPTLKNYQTIFHELDYGRYMLNSAIVAIGTVLLSLSIGLPSAYSIVRFGQRKVALFILLGRIMPGVSVLVPWFILFSRLGLIDTYIGLILAHMVQIFPLVVWLMIGFFEEIPRSVQDQALIDGCSTYSVFYRIVLPLSRPGIAAASILAFILSWNHFMFSLAFAQHRTMTLPVAAYRFIGYGIIDWGGLTAAATVITLPVIILGLLIQRWIVRGLTFGALKG